MNSIVTFISLALLYIDCHSCHAFTSSRVNYDHRVKSRTSLVPIKKHPSDSLIFRSTMTSYPSSIFMASDNDKKAEVDGGISSRLLAETIAPWRSLRLFLYFSLGSGAFVGGLITLSRILAASRFQNDQLDLNPEVNLEVVSSSSL